ncbi:MAG: class I SAM-dependent methyltransferase [Clostridia bacterium]
MTEEYIGLKKWLEETKDVPLENMNSFFDVRIETYEDVMSKWDAHYQWMADILSDKTENLLDIGCGSGLELDKIFKRFPNLKVTGVDFSDEMLKKLQSKHYDKNLTVINSDYFICDLGNEVYDTAISFETLHHFTANKKCELFKKIYDSLKTGGEYIECDYIACDSSIEELVFSEINRRKIRDNIEDEIFVHFDTPLTAEHEMEAMKKAGFSKVERIGCLEGDGNTVMFRCIK